MFSKSTLKPHIYFLKKQLPQSNQNHQSMCLNGKTSMLGSVLSSSTKESFDLKEYAERMKREQRLSSQKLIQLVIIKVVS